MIEHHLRSEYNNKEYHCQRKLLEREIGQKNASIIFGKLNNNKKDLKVASTMSLMIKTIMFFFNFYFSDVIHTN